MIKRLYKIIDRVPKSRLVHFSASVLFSFAVFFLFSLISFRTGLVASLISFPILEVILILSDRENRLADIIDFLSGIAGGIFVCLVSLTIKIILR